MPRTLSGYCNSIASMAASKDQDPSQVLRVYAFFHWTSSANLYEPCPPLVVLPQAWYFGPPSQKRYTAKRARHVKLESQAV